MFAPEETLTARPRLVPRLRLAAGADAAPPRLRRALRLRLLDPAEGRRRSRSKGPAGVAEDVTDLHAWAEVYLPGAGWVGLDATSGLLAARGTSRWPAPPSPQSAAPITGSFSWAKRHDDDERGARSSTSRWRCSGSTRSRGSPSRTATSSGQAIDALGEQVDADWRAGDVRLTMGGEPTFVSIDDRDGDEWNTAALGPTKRGWPTSCCAGCARVRARRPAAPRPGQVVPGRAAAALGVLLLLPARRRADLARPGAARRRERRRAARPRREPTRSASSTALADAPGGRAPARRCPAYEDVFYYLWRERRLPVNVDPLEAGSRTTMERARLARIFEQGLASVGRATRCRCAPQPDERRARAALGAAAPGSCATSACSCCPGDSPMGFRLPLDALPGRPGGRDRDPSSAIRSRRASRWPRARDLPPAPVVDRGRPALRRPPAPRDSRSRPARRRRRGRRRGAARRSAWSRARACCTSSCRRCRARGLPRPRRRRSRTPRASCKLPVRLEGYHAAARSTACSSCRSRPIRACIEVNVHPARSWGELVDNTIGAVRRGARTAAWAPRSSCSTAATPAPAAATTSCSAGRRPPTARSCAGPTCCAAWSATGSTTRRCRTCSRGCSSAPPARRRASTRRATTALYELEIAFAPAAAAATARAAALAGRPHVPPPAGRRHRQHAPHRVLHRQAVQPRQRQRAARACSSCAPSRCRRTRDEPARSSCCCAALVAWFWREPYQPPAGALGHRAASTASCCRTSWRRTSTTCCAICAAPGFPFERDWFAAALRVPLPAVRARSRSAGIELELRQAIEPWHVLGEEAGRRRHGALRRFVGRAGAGARCAGHDRRAPRRRLQRPARAAAPDRHQRRVRGGRALSRLAAAVGAAPDHRRARAAGVRRARHLERPRRRRLHLSRRPSRAAGRYDTFPRNALEAESRRVARFFALRPHAGPVARAGRGAQPGVPPHPRPAPAGRPRPGNRSRGASPPGVRYTLQYEQMCGSCSSAPTAASRWQLAVAALRAPPPGVHDEMLAPRRRGAPALAAASSISCRRWARRSCERRWEKAQHLLHENGVSYNVYGDPRGMERPWSLSPVPVLHRGPTSGRRWPTGLAQRARLLDLLLADLYGPQRALTEGWLPPELVFAHPGFLRAAARHAGRRAAAGCRFTAPIWCAPPTAAGGCWPTAPRRLRAPATRSRTASSSRGSLPELFRDCNVAAAGAVLPHPARDAGRRWRPTTATTRASCC